MELNKQNIIILTYVALSIYTLGLLFDLTVTYTMYATNPSYFLSHEANTFLVENLKAGHPFLLSWDIIATLSLPLSLMFNLWIFKKINLKSQRIFFMYLFFASVLIAVGIGHLYAGSTWWFR